MRLAKKHMIIAAVALGMLAIAGVSQASAAQLTANTTGGLAFLGADKCSGASLTTTAAGTSSSGGTVYPEVAVDGIPTACQSVPLDIYVHGAGGALLASGTVTPGAASVDVTTGDYIAADVTEVVARMGGWVFPTAWNAPQRPMFSNCVAVNQQNVSAPCTITVTNVGAVTSWNDGIDSGTWQAVSVSVTSSLPGTKVRWTSDFNVSAIPGLTVAPDEFGAGWANTIVMNGCGSYPNMTLRGADYQFNLTWFVGDLAPHHVKYC